MSTDPVNYTSMSIASFGEATLPRQSKRMWDTKATNLTQDIDGAQPKTLKVWEKPDLWNNSDVAGAKSNRLHHERNGANNSLRIDDIDGAQAKIRDKMLLTKRNVNPMAPEYKLPSSTAAPAYQPKYTRNTLDISDIDKAQPRVPVVYDMRDPIGVHDIVGAQANWRPRNE